MAADLSAQNKGPRRISRIFRVGLVLFGLLAAAPGLLAQEGDLGEDFISDFFMGAAEGMSQDQPAAPPAQPQPLSKTAGKPPRHKAPEPQAPPPAGPAEPPLQAPPAAPKKAAKPPRHEAFGGMPTAVLEPETGLKPPEEAPASAAEGRPLPVPPGEGTDPLEAGDDYFLMPDELAGTAGEDDPNSLTMPINLGALPSLDWETKNPNEPPAKFISDSPLPQFDSSESNWKQLEIGQAESVAPPPPQEEPGTVSTVLEEPPAPPAAPGTDRERLRSLFSDMLPPPALGARPPASGQIPVNMAGNGGKEPPPPPTEPPAPVAPPPPPPKDAQEEGEIGGSSILRAGGQLTVAGHFGGAAILPPLTGAPDLAAWLEAQKEAEKQKNSPAPEKTEAGEKAEKEPGAPEPQKKAASPKRSPKAGPASAPVRSPLSLINETGNERMLEIYRSVLSQMGYRIVSAESRPASAQPTGEIFILYRPGLRSRARAVAGHLPGRKTIMESTAALPAEISILLR